MLRWIRWSFRPAFFVLMLVVVASCSGSGCSGCASCGMTPLPAGFPQASVIPNAASFRVTRPGLDFVAANIGNVAGKVLNTNGGVITFNVGATSSSFTIGTAYVCQSPSQGQCVADVNVAGAKLNVDAVTPHALQITGTVPVKVDDIPVDVKGPFGIDLGTIEVGVGTGGCNGGTPAVDYTPVPVSATIPIVNETTPPRDGYSMVDAANAQISATIDPNSVQLCGGLLASVADLFKSTLVGQLTAPLQNTLKNQLQSQLCTKPDATVTPPCPTGTQPNSGNTQCVFTSNPNTCLPTLLGMDGHMDLGKLVQKYSPGNAASVDLVLAGAGDADPAPDCQANQLWTAAGGCATDPNPPYSGHTPNGLTLGMIGGMLPNPQATCVPIVQNQLPQNIPIPDELTKDGVQPWPTGDNGPDIGLAIAGRFLNYAATSAYNSGVLCLGVSTDSFQALSTGYVSAVVPSLKYLTFEPGKTSKPAAMAITTRPQKPPTIKLGNGTDIKTDPLLSITLPQFAIDFYVWSVDRFVRAFTFTSDLTIPVNLQTGKDPTTNPNGGILPVIGDLAAANGSVTNSGLVFEDPNLLSGALSSLLGGIVGQFLGKGFAPINISSSLASYGLALNIPAGGFRKLSKTTAAGRDDFLALFADLATATTGPIKTAETHASIGGMEIHPEAMKLESAVRALFPKLQVSLDSPEDDGTTPVEYTYWIDEQPHAAWTRSRQVTVDDQYLFLQGKHVLYASARIVGEPDSEDPTPAAAPFLIDVIAPTVAVDVSDGKVSVSAYDFVSDDSALLGRTQLTDAKGVTGAWTDWQPLAALATIDPGAASSIEVQVIDEAGNVAASNQLIRGRPDPTLQAAGSACGCSTPGASTGPTLLASLAILAGLGVLVARRRRAAAVALGSLGVVAATSQGCSCGSNAQNNASTQTGCGSDCNQTCGPANLQGLIGEYTSVAVASDGTIWVAGYNDADVSNAELYGDLVAGKYDTGKQQVNWQDVDGLPPARTDGSCPPNDPSTWRHGETDPGPDVGLWTSIQVDSNNNPMISYYDATNAAVKFASSTDGGNTWNSHTVMQAAQSDIGRYSKLLVVNGKPTIAFLVVEPGTGGWAKSRVVLATGNVATPQSSSDWSMQDVIVDTQTPCRAAFCPTGQVCVQTTMQCQATVSGCTPADCGASTAGIGSTPQSCVTISGKPTCSNVEDKTYIDTYPDATGDYIAMASGAQGVGIIVYDRTRGNLVGVARQGNQWNAQILDGQTGQNSDPKRVDTGDVGVGASLVIASNGDWHVSYVNGWTEAVQYLILPGGNFPAQPSQGITPEVVDTGTGLNGTPYTDGQHIVGDDSSVSVDSSGAVRVVYQDATVGSLLEATGTPSTGNTHKWSVKALAQQNKFAGFFPHYVPQAQQVANWFRLTDHTQNPPVVSGDVALVAP
jgi:MYXO-CTERM domain-containing protein